MGVPDVRIQTVEARVHHLERDFAFHHVRRREGTHRQLDEEQERFEIVVRVSGFGVLQVDADGVAIELAAEDIDDAGGDRWP